jgi:hypothetical protein
MFTGSVNPCSPWKRPGLWKLTSNRSRGSRPCPHAQGRTLTTPMLARPFLTPSAAILNCHGKVESSAFRRVPDASILFIFSAIPSMNIVLHRGHPSRLPFGAQPRRGPDGTRPRCEETRSGMREWQALLWLTVLKAELSTLPDRNFLLCPDTANCFTGHSPQKVI